MSIINTLVLNWLLVLPFFGAAAAALFPSLKILPHSPREAKALERGACYFGALISLLGFSLAVRLVLLLARGETVSADYLWTRDLYHLRFQADGLTGVAALLVFGAGTVMFMHLTQAGSARNAQRGAPLLLLAQGGLISLAAAADVMLLVFCLGIAVFSLALFASADTPPHRRSVLLNGHLAWSLVLLAAMLLWRQADDTSLAQIPLLVLTKPPMSLRAIALVGLFGAAPLLAGAPGYGRWPAAAKAAPAQGGLSAVLLVVAGGVVLSRLLPGSLLLPAVPGVAGAARWLGLSLLWGGALAAWRAHDLRGRAGWLTAAQAGYPLLAIAGAAGPAGSATFLKAAALHFVVAPVALLAIWLATLTVLHRARADTVAGLSGLLGRMPLAGMAFLAGGLSLAGMPPLAGFREQFLLLSATAAHHPPLLFAAVLAADLLIAAVVLDSFWRVFLRGQPPEVSPGTLALAVPLAVTVLALLVAGIWPGPWQTWAETTWRTVLTLRPAL